MTFPVNPAINDPWTEGGVDYTFDGVRWRPDALGVGSGLTPQQQKIFNGLTLFAQASDYLVPPSNIEFTPKAAYGSPGAIVRGAESEYQLMVSGRNNDNFSLEINWGHGEPVETIVLRLGGADFPNAHVEVNGSFIYIKHTHPAEAALGEFNVGVKAINDWGDTGPFDFPIWMSEQATDWTFTYSSLLAGVAAPTKASMSDGDSTTTVFATARRADDPSGNPSLTVDFGEVVNPHWITIRRAKGTHGGIDLESGTNYRMSQRWLERGVDDGEGGITWTRDSAFEGVSWNIVNDDSWSFQMKQDQGDHGECRYLRLRTDPDWNQPVNHDGIGIAIGDISFGHANLNPSNGGN
ncbi:hypothetical protein D3C71_79610 [compost metagenome]